MTSKQLAAWPTRPDGSQMTLGEMPKSQRLAVARASASRVARQMTANAPAIAKVLRDFDAEQAASGNADSDEESKRHGGAW